MESASTRGQTGYFPSFVSGLQAGMIGVLTMLAFLGVAAVWRGLTFWTPENLMATAFYGAAALRYGFSSQSISGMALYVLIYSTLGGLLGLALGRRFSYRRTVLAGVLFGVCWYYLAYRLIWIDLLPMVALLHPGRQTLIGHVLFGLLAGRFQTYLGGGTADLPASVEPVEAAPSPQGQEDAGIPRS